jgi:ABC-type branched-subunit amino acid transport system ATPase component
MTLIEVGTPARRFGSLGAVADVSFEVGEGELVNSDVPDRSGLPWQPAGGRVTACV